MKKKSIAVLGLGKFGISLVKTLDKYGADVMAADKVEDFVNEVSDCCTAAVCADLSIEENLLKLGLKDMDIVVVAMGESLEPSILAVAVAKEAGVPMIVAKSSSARMSSILQKVGANKVIMPEEYAGMRSAALLISENLKDYFQVSDKLCMVEMVPLESWIGKSVIELNVRKKYNLTIIGVKDQDDNWVPIDPDHPIQKETILLAVTDPQHLNRLGNK